MALKHLSSSLTGGCCHLHDLHHGPAYRVCGHRADLQRPAQPQRPRCGQCPDEGLSGHMFCCLFIATNEANKTFCHAAVRCSSPANLQTSSSCPVLSTLHQMKNSRHSYTGLYLSVHFQTETILQHLHHFYFLGLH